MKIHASFKLFIQQTPIRLDELEEISFTEGWKQAIQSFVIEFSVANTAITAYTSGSTGEPKKIELIKLRMAKSSELTAAYFKLKEESTALLCLSADYIAGKMMLVRAMTQGWSLYCVAPVSNPIDHLNYDFAAMVPLQAYSSISQLKQISTLIIGGGILNHESEQALINSGHGGLFQTFGMTETTSHIGLKKLGQLFYQTLEGIEVSLTNEDCLIINAPMLLDAPLTTNDLVEVENKHSFKWLGRKDNVINSGGIKIHPENVEHKISKWLSVPFFIIGQPDEKLGEKVVLFVEGSPLNEIQNIIGNSRLSRYETPREIKYIPAFSRTESGKIKRRESSLLNQS